MAHEFRGSKAVFCIHLSGLCPVSCVAGLDRPDKDGILDENFMDHSGGTGNMRTALLVVWHVGVLGAAGRLEEIF